MLRARRFTFGSYSLDTSQSCITFTYRTDLESGKELEFTDTLTFPDVPKDAWDRFPAKSRSAFLDTLCLMQGLTYWKLHCAPEIRIEDFTLSRDQASFWNTLYTKGLAEYFFLTKIDFRGLVIFPFREDVTLSEPISHHDNTKKLLVANGGGKDSILSAEILKQMSVPFDVYTSGETRTQRRVNDLIRRPRHTVTRKRDPRAKQISDETHLPQAAPSICNVICISTFYAALMGYRYIVLSNEKSADIGNIEYLGMEVNHQWSKTLECEQQMQAYINRFLHSDITIFSLLRHMTEIETTRRFTAYPQYFKAFSSCNQNFRVPRTTLDAVRPGYAYWCNTCPKCVFMFSCLSAFLPKETVIDIFGTNIHANQDLLPTYRELLGIEGFKPFECVGTPEEMIVAMDGALKSGSYDDEAAISVFREHFSNRDIEIKAMRQKVLAEDSSVYELLTMPEGFPIGSWG